MICAGSWCWGWRRMSWLLVLRLSMPLPPVGSSQRNTMPRRVSNREARRFSYALDIRPKRRWFRREQHWRSPSGARRVRIAGLLASARGKPIRSSAGTVTKGNVRDTTMPLPTPCYRARKNTSGMIDSIACSITLLVQKRPNGLRRRLPNIFHPSYASPYASIPFDGGLLLPFGVVSPAGDPDFRAYSATSFDRIEKLHHPEQAEHHGAAAGQAP